MSTPQQTAADLVREVFPNATDNEVEHLLWEHTPFPMVPADEVRAALIRHRDDLAAGQWRCARCGAVQPMPTARDGLCPPCSVALQVVDD